MKEIKLYILAPPNPKPEFLATVTVVDPSPAVSKIWNGNELVTEVVLEGYTRDGWACQPSPLHFTTMTVESIDGRNKLPRFLSYLQDRQKACFGRFASTGVWVVSHAQKKPSNNPNRMECGISLDFTKLPGCNLKPKSAPAAMAAAKPPQPETTADPAKKKSGGLLGKLVGAQKRTNQHLIHATTTTTTSSSSSSSAATTATTATTAATTTTKTASRGVAAAPPLPVTAVSHKTAQQVMNEFRQAMESKMLDFDIAPDEQLKISLSLPEYTAGLSDSEKPKITMEILKYMVYEAAEEVNEDWIAHKEPSEFLDEAVISVYKEGAAPPEVLEEINKAEMPDEVRGHQQALQQERLRQLNQAESRKASALEQQAHQHAHARAGGDGGQEDDGNSLAALNQIKRDRRTVADFEREKKRGKTS